MSPRILHFAIYFLFAWPMVVLAQQVSLPIKPAQPSATDVVTRDADDIVTVRAIELTENLDVDGQLDEGVYRNVPSISDFIQQLPDEGALATEKTETWIMFDDTAIYVAARCFDASPPDQWVANEMRRDAMQLRQNDSFSVLFDTFYDRRNGVAFLVNPIGGFADFAVTNEGIVNSDWNPVWDVRTSRFDGGWTVEMEIPFKSLRYRAGTNPVWGVQLRRIIRRRTEASYLTALPISAARGNSVIAGLWRVSQGATLVGLKLPKNSLNLEIKPYGIGGVTSALNKVPPQRNVGDIQLGIDAKYGITQNLTGVQFTLILVGVFDVNRFPIYFYHKLPIVAPIYLLPPSPT